MSVTRFHIGIDFGTSQTKVCVQHTSAHPPVHEFLLFSDGRGDNSLFLPSKVWLRGDGTLAFGHRPAGFVGNAFEYFKIAAAEDHVFRTEAALSESTPYYEAGEYEPFTPELLSVFYLAYVLLVAKEHVRAAETAPAPRRGLLRRKRSTPEPTFRFTAQLGFPTEYLSTAHAARKLKFETIFVLADALAERYGSASALRSASASELQAAVVSNLRKLAEAPDKKERLQRELDERRLSVFPESAAGLASLVRTGRLEPGYYAALDIGGGSTDLSFFRVNEDRSTSYLASESVLLAANNVYRAYGGDSEASPAMQLTTEAEQRLRALINERGKYVVEDRDYKRAVGSVTESVYRAMYRVFNQRVYWLFDRGRAFVNPALGTFKDRPCFVYGGGGALPFPEGAPMRLERITVHDNGRPDCMDDANYTWLYRKPLDSQMLAPQVDLRPRGPALDRNMALLAVAYGLSHPHRASEAVWDDHDYRRNSYDFIRVQHPINEGMYIYDVVERKWR